MITLKELFNAPLDVEVPTGAHDYLSVKFKVDGALYDIYFEFYSYKNETELGHSSIISKHDIRYPVAFLYVEFSKRKQEDNYTTSRISPTPHFIRVFSTVIYEIRKQIERAPNSIIKYLADIDEPSRVKLYDRMTRVLAKNDYVIESAVGEKYKTYYLIPKHIIINQK